MLRTKPSTLFPLMPTASQTFSIVDTVPQKVLEASAARAGIVFMVDPSPAGATASQVNFWIQDGLNQSQGIVLGNVRTVQVLTFKDWGPIIASEWYCNAKTVPAGLTMDITVYTYDYRPDNFGA